MIRRIGEILFYLYQFRFLTRNQIQELLGHKHFNRVIVWLNQLTETKYIRRYYNPKAVTIPAIYSLGTKGRKYFLENENDKVNPDLLDRVWREPKLSDQFRQHCIFVANCYLSLNNFCFKNSLKLQFISKTQLLEIEDFINPKPDAYVAIEEKKGIIGRYFIDVFDQMPPRMWMRKRARQYLDFFDEGYWQDNYPNREFPKIIMITIEDRSKRYLKRFIKSKLDEYPELEFFVGTRKDIEEKGLNNSALEKVEDDWN